MVNADVDGYNKTLNHRKMLRKTQKNKNLLKTKRTLKPTISSKLFRPGFHILLAREVDSPSGPPSITPLKPRHGCPLTNHVRTIKDHRKNCMFCNKLRNYLQLTVVVELRNLRTKYRHWSASFTKVAQLRAKVRANYEAVKIVEKQFKQLYSQETPLVLAC